MAISSTQLDTILEAWRMEHGFGECSQLAEDDKGQVGYSARPVVVGTLADEFNDAWAKLAGGNTREWRMEMALRGKVFGSDDPIELNLQRLHRFGIRMIEQEFRDHVEWARAYFCATLTYKRAA